MVKGDPFIKLRAESKQSLSTRFSQRDEVEFFQHHQIEVQSLGNEAMEGVVILCLQEFVDQPGCGPETHFVFVTAGLQSKTDSQVGFTQSRIANKDQGLLSFYMR
jgi:hypothetical protein